MAISEGNPRNNPEARRAALHERLNSFQEKVTEGFVVDETEEAHITFTRNLTPEQLPKRLKALLFVVGATSKDLKLEYGFTQKVDSQSSGLASISWDTNVDNNSKIYEEEVDVRTARGRLESWRSDIKSIAVSASESRNWEVKFWTNNRGSYVEFDEKDQSFKSRNPSLFARLKAAHDLLNAKDGNFQLQEEIVSLLDINAESSNLKVFKKELDSHRYQRQEQEGNEGIQNEVAALMSVANKILEGK